MRLSSPPPKASPTNRIAKASTARPSSPAISRTSRRPVTRSVALTRAATARPNLRSPLPSPFDGQQVGPTCLLYAVEPAGRDTLGDASTRLTLLITAAGEAMLGAEPRASRSLGWPRNGEHVRPLSRLRLHGMRSPSRRRRRGPRLASGRNHAEDVHRNHHLGEASSPSDGRHVTAPTSDASCDLVLCWLSSAPSPT